MITRLDHIVLTVRSIETTVAFYTRVLGMQEVTFGEGRKALSFGRQKINLHEKGREFEPKANRPTPGSADLCLICDISISELMKRFSDMGLVVVEGPVSRTGAEGAITSLYIRDPDLNLIEVSTYDHEVG